MKGLPLPNPAEGTPMGVAEPSLEKIVPLNISLAVVVDFCF